MIMFYLISIKVLLLICAKRENSTIRTTQKDIELNKINSLQKRFLLEVLCTCARNIV